MRHNLEIIDADGRQFCTRCGSADSDDLARPCTAMSDGEIYQRGLATCPVCGGVGCHLWNCSLNLPISG